MSVGADYAFLSLLRRGLAALIQPGAAPAGARVAVPVTLQAGGSAVSAPTLALRGPGDIAGFDPGVVRRTWPAAGADNAESNYFALAELSDADLPWRYSPEAPSGDRLTPWLCLIVVADSEIGDQVQPAAGRPLAAVTVTAADALPDLSQAWAWAHAQILGAPDPAGDYDAASVGAILTGAPSRASSRLLCPRQLRPQTSYQAFLVPTFERGRLAGLGQPTDGIDLLAAAWKPAQQPVTLPVYFSWSFQTGEAGDFASLVAKLQPVAEVPTAVWQRELALSPPGADPVNWQVIEMESALLPLATTVAAWPTLDEHGFTAALAAQTNATGPELTPPLYGRWLAAAAALETAADATPSWFHQLNGDPRARVAAGLGTAVVQTEQQQLLAGAWAQVAGIRAANEQLRLSQLARELALRLYTRHLLALDSQTLLEVSAPVHGRIPAAGATVAAQLAASPILPGALAPAWRRAARPLGTLASRQNRPAGATAAAGGMLARLNSGALSVLPGQPTAGGGKSGAAARLGSLAAAFARANVEPEKLVTVSRPDGFHLLAYTAATSSTSGSVTTSGGPHAVHGAPHVASEALEAGAPAAAAAAAGTAAAAAHPTAAVSAAASGATYVSPPTNPQPAAAAAAFIAAAGTLMNQLTQPPAAGTVWIEADLAAASAAIQATLDPIETIEKPLAARLTGVDAGPRRTDPLEPVMAAPLFPQPMYAPLFSVGREWLLPGLDQLGPDAIALFTTNWPFMESFLVGLNHELARKLLWNGYPTDQRGSYFRRFWDIHGDPTASDGDVGPLHLWTAPLGQNRQLSRDPLVLLVRGELIRRYPNLVVTAAAAVPNNGLRQPGASELDPVFFALVAPDIALFGFDVDPAAARGNPGWFFVLQEHPSEPRFGLAVSAGAFGAQPASWQTLGWDHLAASEVELAALGYIDLTAALPRNPAAADPTGSVWHANGSQASRSADLAHITLRQPKRLAVHGSMLIPLPPPATPSAGGGGGG